MRLHQNVGTVDRIIRVAAGLVLGAVLIAGWISVPLAYAVGAVAAILFVTGAVGFCPIYALLRISTRPTVRATTSLDGR
jgi:hypothetical protein